MKTTGKPINRHVASIRQALPPVMPAKSDKTKDVPEPTADQRTVFDKNLAHNRQKALLGEDYGPRKAPGPAVCSLEAADRVLPTLQEAVADPLFSMLAPSDIPVPDDVVKALAGGKRVLVVGHTPPDGDCVGSALGLKRGLEALGKEVDAVVDSDLPGNLRTLGDAGELKKANALGDEPYDLVVLVDVANAKRIGNAADFLPKAKAVLALDHHHETPTHEGLGISDDVKLTTWIETSAESATYLVAGALDKTAKALGADLSDAWPDVSKALVAGQLTDTQDFSVPGTAHFALMLAKHLTVAHLDGDANQALAPLLYALPEDAQMASHTHMPFAHKEDEGLRFSSMAASIAGTEAVLQKAQEADPDANLLDVKGFLQDRLDQTSRTSDVAVMLFEENGGVRVSTRSKKEQPAIDLAEQLGGGGKAHSGGAFLADVSLQRAQNMVDLLAAQFFLKEGASLRLRQ